MFNWCIVTWFMLSLKVFIAFYRTFTYFKISFYWVDIPEFIFWMKLWILWKDTDVSFFFDCSMFLVSNISDVSIRFHALWEAMQNRWGLRTWRLIQRRSILLLFWDSSREPRLRNLRVSLNLSKEIATANQTAGESTAEATSNSANLTTFSSAYHIKRCSPSSTKTP